MLQLNILKHEHEIVFIVMKKFSNQNFVEEHYSFINYPSFRKVITVTRK